MKLLPLIFGIAVGGDDGVQHSLIELCNRRRQAQVGAIGFNRKTKKPGFQSKRGLLEGLK